MFDEFGRCADTREPMQRSYPAAMSPTSAHAVAAELRSRLPGVTRLKLHKLLYYCQGHHLAGVGEPLFSDRISAWDKGPVVGSLWHDENDGEQVPTPRVELAESALNTIGYVLSRYGALSGRDLVNLTHSELPWQRADSGRPPGGSVPIAPEWMHEYFRDEPPEEGEIAFDPMAVTTWLSDAEARLDLPASRDDPEQIGREIAALRAGARRRETR